MKRSRFLALALVALLMLALLAGCAKSYSEAKDGGYYANATNGGTSTGASGGAAYSGYNKADYDAPSVSWEEAELPKQDIDYTEKLIYTANITMQTVTFEDTLAGLKELVEQSGGFIEASYVSGRDYASTYYGTKNFRTANYVIRVPSAAFESVTGSLAALGTVTDTHTSVENVTTQYYDMQSRITALRTEENSLLEILAKCETVEDLITVQSRLSDVRYQIENIQTNLNHLDHQVSYSTVNLTIREVEELTKIVPVQRTYWEQIGDGLADTFDGIGRFFKNLFKNFIIALPVIILVVGFIALFIFILVKVERRVVRNHKNKKDKAAPQTPEEKK